jgi:hypothetical protein
VGIVEAPVLRVYLGHPAEVLFLDQVVLPAVDLPLVLAGTWGLQVQVCRVEVLVVGGTRAHPVGGPVGVQRLAHREDPVGAAEVPQEAPAEAVAPPGN